MQGLAKNGDGMTRTIDRLNRDPHFASPFPTSENRTDRGFEFGIGVDYRPSIARIVE